MPRFFFGFALAVPTFFATAIYGILTWRRSEHAEGNGPRYV